MPQQAAGITSVIVGCGFGGLFAAKTLRRADVDVTGTTLPTSVTARGEGMR